eukprot:14610788-Alexandrium_andersonii.AAC.1
MARVRLVQKPARSPSDDPIKQLHFLQVRGTSAQPPLHLAHELVVHEGLHLIQVVVVPREGEVVAVHDTAH